MDETSGGLGTPQCPAKVVVNQAFKDGTAPTVPCPIHSPQASAPTVDQFGNPIQLGAPPATSTEGMVPTDTNPPPDSTLTGGVFRTDTTDTGAPPPVEPQTDTAPPPPPPRERERDRDRPREPQPQPEPQPTSTGPPPSTNTSLPPPSTNTSPP
jgi:hypothetical protein